MNKKQINVVWITLVIALVAALFPPQRVLLTRGDKEFYSGLFWAPLFGVGQKIECPKDLTTGYDGACIEQVQIYYEAIIIEALIIFVVGHYLIYLLGLRKKWHLTAPKKKKEWLSDD